MAGQQKKGGPMVPAGILMFVFAAIMVLAPWLLRDTLILYYGIRLWRVVQIGLLAGAGAFAVGGVLFLGAAAKGRRQGRLQEEKQQLIEEEGRREERRRSARLSVEGEMDARTVKELLIHEAKGRWESQSARIFDCVEQMEQMDSYQDRLARLIRDNGAESLSDTEEMLDQVEQYLCRNVRSVLNFMAVADDDAREQVGERLTECREQNRSLLSQTRDFLYALAEFLNKQGGQTDTRLLNTYRETILKTIGGEE